MMSDYLARCQVCNAKIGNNVCKKCGRSVCENHYDMDTGLCSACKQGKVFVQKGLR